MPGMILCVHETDLVCKGLMHSHPVLESVECRDDNELPNPAKKHKYKTQIRHESPPEKKKFLGPSQLVLITRKAEHCSFLKLTIEQ